MSLQGEIAEINEMDDEDASMLEKIFSASPEEHEIESDPLLEETTTIKPNLFIGEFDDDEFLNTDDSLDEDNKPLLLPAVRKSGPGRPKKQRLITDAILGRNGHVWSTVRPATGQEPAAHASRGKGPARNVDNPLAAWELLFDAPMLSQLLRQTNEQIKVHRGKANHEKSTDLVELRAWLGLCYLCGVFRHSPQLSGPLDELWTLELGNAIFRATMSLKRFEFLAASIRLGQPNARNMAATVSQVWDKFIINCRSYYAPSTHCSIDEHLLGAVEREPPPVKDEGSVEGLHVLTLCDAKSLYLCNALMCSAAKDSDILRLVSDVKGTHRNIILSERYNSLKLAEKLHACELSAIGALNPDTPELPDRVERPLYAANATLLNTGVQQALLCSGLSARLNASQLYARTRETAARFRQRAHSYSAAFATPPNDEQRRPLQVLHTLLDFAALNAWVLLRLSTNGGAHIEQRDFLRQLGLYLTQQHLRRRLQRRDNKLTVPLKLQITEILGESVEKLLAETGASALRATSQGSIPGDRTGLPDGVTLVSKQSLKHGRCRRCPKSAQKKTRMRCQQCGNIICSRHLIFRCNECTGVQPPPDDMHNDAVDQL